MIMDIFHEKSLKEDSKFCGFTWFVIPKLLINQKYRMRRILHKDSFVDLEEDEKEEKKEKDEESDE